MKRLFSTIIVKQLARNNRKLYVWFENQVNAAAAVYDTDDDGDDFSVGAAVWAISLCAYIVCKNIRDKWSCIR